MKEKNYERVNWQARKTPISAANLNRMDEGIATNRSAIQELQSAIDSELSSTSTNPVQNKVIYQELKDLEDNKQTRLESGTNIKTINGESILGSGNITIEVDDELINDLNEDVSILQNSKQDTLVSGTNIKTINGESLLGEGDLTIETGNTITVDEALDVNSTNPVQNKAIYQELKDLEDNKQPRLESGTNIKTVNGESILGSGNIEIQDSGAYVDGETLYLNATESGSSGGSSSGSTGGGGVFSVFEDVTAIPENPDEQKIYRVSGPQLYIYSGTTLYTLKEALDIEVGVPTIHNIIPVNELPQEPIIFADESTLTFTIYVMNNSIYGWLTTDGTNYSWLSDSTLTGLFEMTYGGLVESLDTSSMTSGSVYLYYNIEKYINVVDDVEYRLDNKKEVVELFYEDTGSVAITQEEISYILTNKPLIKMRKVSTNQSIFLNYGEMSEMDGSTIIVYYTLSDLRCTSGNGFLTRKSLLIINTSTLQCAFNAEYDEIVSAELQTRLLSGKNIKTINGESLLGEGDITIEGGGTSFIDVTELPTENIDKNSTYRLFEVYGFHNCMQGVSVHIVDTLPETGENCTIDGSYFTNMYYNKTNDNVYGYVDSTLATAFSITAGWHPASDLMTIGNVAYGGIIGSPEIFEGLVGVEIENDKYYFVRRYSLYNYTNKWNVIKEDYYLLSCATNENESGSKLAFYNDTYNQPIRKLFERAALNKDIVITSGVPSYSVNYLKPSYIIVTEGDTDKIHTICGATFTLDYSDFEPISWVLDWKTSMGVPMLYIYSNREIFDTTLINQGVALIRVYAK